MAISIQDKVGLTCDNVPTQNSDNAVKSGGVFTALEGKQDKGNYVGGNDFANFYWSRRKESNEQVGLTFVAIGDDTEDFPSESLAFDRVNKRIKLFKRVGTTWTQDATFTADEDTGWLKLEAYKTGFEANGYGIDYRRKNGWCIIQITVRTTEAFAVNAGKTIATLPAGFRPSTLVNFSLSIGNNVADAHDVIGYAYPDGRIDSLYRFGNIPSGAYLLGSVSYPV